MRFCTSCGHQLGIGRFCTNCGRRVENPATDHEEWRTDTAERPAVPPEPPAPRYPLFADEGYDDEPRGSAVRVDDLEDGLTADPAGEGSDSRSDGGLDVLPMSERSDPVVPTRQQRRLFAVLVSIVAVWALVAVFGVVLLLHSRGGGSANAEDDSPSLSASATVSTSPSPTTTPKGPAPIRDVARLATARAPAVAPPTTDVDGAPVSFGAAHMLDHDHTTCWRMEGDGTDRTIIFTLRSPTRISRVGLVNGYAKVAHDSAGNVLDWYLGNRRILAVQWEFDDGSTVEQDLREVRHMQRIKVPNLVTSTVRLKLLSVSSPGAGIASRDDTAISEISLIGRPA